MRTFVVERWAVVAYIALLGIVQWIYGATRLVIKAVT